MSLATRSLVQHSFRQQAFECVSRVVIKEIMSINDKVKVIWKTNCRWRDHAHWPKRKEIKLNDDDFGDEKELLSLKPGDPVKVKFGGRWYVAEVDDNWEPKSKKGKYFQPLLTSTDLTLEIGFCSYVARMFKQGKEVPRSPLRCRQAISRVLRMYRKAPPRNRKFLSFIPMRNTTLSNSKEI